MNAIMNCLFITFFCLIRHVEHQSSYSFLPLCYGVLEKDRNNLYPWLELYALGLSIFG